MNKDRVQWILRQLLPLTEQRSANLHSSVQRSRKSLKRLKDIPSKWDKEQNVLDKHTQIWKTSVFNTGVAYEQQPANRWVSET